MSYPSLKKKLQPAKKAWKSFSKTMESKLHSFNFSKAVNVVKTNSDRLLSYCSHHLYPFFTKHSAYFRRHSHSHRRRYGRRSGNNSRIYQYCYSNKNNKDRYHRKLNFNFSPIYLDQFYSVRVAGSTAVQDKNLHSGLEPSSSNGSSGRSFRRVKKATDEKDSGTRVLEEGNKGKEKILYSIEDAWREVVANSPQLRPVDERAEEFISNFRQGMRLQKQKSSLDFQEMLSRGT